MLTALIVFLILVTPLLVLTLLAGRAHTKPMMDWLAQEEAPIEKTRASWDDES